MLHGVQDAVALCRAAIIGQVLIRLCRAEDLLHQRGFRLVEVGVEKDNPDAQRLYQRLGYTVYRALREEYGYTTPDGVRHWHVVDQWILRKPLEVQLSESGQCPECRRLASAGPSATSATPGGRRCGCRFSARGAHFCGLNARHFPWQLEGRYAEEWIADHWQRHLPRLRRLVGSQVASTV